MYAQEPDVAKAEQDLLSVSELLLIGLSCSEVYGAGAPVSCSQVLACSSLL